MRRYLPKPAVKRTLTDEWWEADATDSLAKTVYEPDGEPRPTGLYDASGTELYAVDEREPIGFVAHKGKRKR